jgi:hypothetical protein
MIFEAAFDGGHFFPKRCRNELPKNWDAFSRCGDEPR